MKKVIALIAVVLIGLVTIPLWGGCDLNAKLCRGWCEVRHFSQDMKAAGCRARCAADKLRCLADQGSGGVDDFVDGFNR
ncbi:MAG: hypothetical protein ACQETD_05545 [Pseudomonadota bacterium]